MKQLRPYQAQALEQTSQLFRENPRRVLICCPPGGGKTFIASSAAKAAVENGKKVLWVAHRSELVDQAAKTLREATRCPVGIFQGSRRQDKSARIQVASIQTLIRREEVPEADLVIGDEAHRLLADQWHGLLETYSNARFIYLTATPERGDGRPMGDLATAIVPTVQPSELVAEGVLVPCEIIAPKAKVKDGIADDPVDAYVRWGKGRRAIFFCQSKDHAQAVSIRLNERGIPNGVVTDSTPWATRQAIYRRVSDGTLRALVNVMVATEGLDIPPLSVCVIARSVGHSSMYIQMVGRVMRAAPKKDSALIIDLKGVARKFGSPEADRTYSLEGDEAVTIDAQSKEGKICPDCGCYSTALTCPACGLPGAERKLVPDVVGESMEVMKGLDHSGEAAREFIHIIEEMRSKRVPNFSRAASEEFARRKGCYPSPSWMMLYADFLKRKNVDFPEWWPESMRTSRTPVAAE